MLRVTDGFEYLFKVMPSADAMRCLARAAGCREFVQTIGESSVQLYLE